jgi:predicted nucleic acid-binding protein
MVLVDTNVILDVATEDASWSDWGRHQLVHWLDAGPVVINTIVYGEFGFACERIEILDALLPAHLYDYLAIPREAAFLAARAHGAYRERGGTRQMNRPDFLIGAHALMENLALLIRDGRRYRQAFPELKLITPQA